MPKSKFSAILSLFLVFLSGALVGVLAHRAYVMNTATAGPPPPKKRGGGGPAEWRKVIVPQMKSRLNLDDGQVVQLNQILDETDRHFRENHDKWNDANKAIQKTQVESIKGILRPDQQALYDEWLATRERERERRMQQMQRNGGQPPKK